MIQIFDEPEGQFVVIPDSKKSRLTDQVVQEFLSTYRAAHPGVAFDGLPFEADLSAHLGFPVMIAQTYQPKTYVIQASEVS